MRPYSLITFAAVMAMAASQQLIRVRGRPRALAGAPLAAAAPLPLAAAVPVAAGPVVAAPGGCPEPEGLQLYDDPASCNRFFKCANGTLTHEACENGLLFDAARNGAGATHNHCSYNWGVDCGKRPADLTAITTPGCEFQFGIYPAAGAGHCLPTYVKCAFGVPQEEPCELGLVYDDRIHACNWPDQLAGPNCDPSDLVGGFRCPSEPELGPKARAFWPFPRFAIQNQPDVYVTCVNQLPRLNRCGEGSLFDPATLGCVQIV